uniref:Inositol polyphosphate 1-phosphatase n=2 Tax=Lygus hesperus TaxID=30085 RepID=A0A0A9WUI3_LYGHE
MSSEHDFLGSLLAVAAKAGRIAKACREDEHLLSLLVQEKKENEKNPRFLHDFKTLADVLVQEVIKYHISSKFPELKGHIYGEETNEFSNDEGSIIVEVKDTELETTTLLNQVLDDERAATALAKVIHNDNEDVEEVANHLSISQLPEELGIWIDPIDSTSEYIQGRTGQDNGLVRTGLPCVTVLIGVFDRQTGAPLVGVVNQPFAEKDDGWTSKYFYGVNLQDLNVSHPPLTPTPNEKLVAVSSSEDADIKELLSGNGYTPIELAGAGYKLLKIITGEVCAYVLSKPTTFLWDTCACNAILEAQGGGIINYSTLEPLRYRAGQGVKECCNDGGIIAYRNDEIINHLIQILNLVK